MVSINLEVRPINKRVANRFIKKYHYSKIMPRLTKLHLGFFKEGEPAKIQGVVTLGWGTQPEGTINKLFYNHNLKTKDYYEIGKMAFLPENNGGNFGSQATSVLIKWIKDKLDIMFLYTLADGIMGKCGYVYQASNFKYIGKFKTYVYMDRKTKEKIHPRSARKLLEENANFEGKDKVHWLTDNFCQYKGIDKIQGYMFRYIYPLNKKAKKILNQYDEYIGNDHPKDDKLKFKKRVSNNNYKEVAKPKFNMNYFKHNYQNNTKKQQSLF